MIEELEQVKRDMKRDRDERVEFRVVLAFGVLVVLYFGGDMLYYYLTH